jgi:hypothetical protein
VLIYESNGVKQVLWNGRHTASNVDLAREVTVCEELQLRNVEVLRYLVGLGVWKKQYRFVLCKGR